MTLTRASQIQKAIKLLAPPPDRRDECRRDIEHALDRVEAAASFKIMGSKSGKAGLRRYAKKLGEARAAYQKLGPYQPWFSDKWDALPKAYKSLLTIACGYANMDVQARYDARNPQAIKRLVAAGTQLRPFSQAIMEACLKASNEVNAETSAVNPDFKKILDSQTEFRNDGNLWWQVAEYSYETFMIRTRPKG